MGTLQRLVRRLSLLRDREAWEQQANEEMEFHLAMREKRNRENGMAPDEARNAALRAFGNPHSVARAWSRRMGLVLSRRFSPRFARCGARLTPQSGLRDSRRWNAGARDRRLYRRLHARVRTPPWSDAVCRCRPPHADSRGQKERWFRPQRYLTRKFSAFAECIHQLSRDVLVPRQWRDTHGGRRGRTNRRRECGRELLRCPGGESRSGTLVSRGRYRRRRDQP